MKAIFIKIGRFFKGIHVWVWDFSDKKPSWFLKIFTILTVLAVQFLWLWCVTAILSITGKMNLLQDLSYWQVIGVNKVEFLAQQSILSSVFFGCVMAPLWEDAVFRGAVISRTQALFPGDNRQLIYAIIVSSVVFGILHGGVVNVLIQGVGGLFLSYVYLKNGNCILSAMIMHSLYNLVIILAGIFMRTNLLLHALG